MLKTITCALTIVGMMGVSNASWAQNAGTAAGAQSPMTNGADAANPAMQNGAMQQPMATTPSANGSGALKDNAEANQQNKMMMQQNKTQ